MSVLFTVDQLVTGEETLSFKWRGGVAEGSTDVNHMYINKAFMFMQYQYIQKG